MDLNDGMCVVMSCDNDTNAGTMNMCGKVHATAYLKMRGDQFVMLTSNRVRAIDVALDIFDHEAVIGSVGGGVGGVDLSPSGCNTSFASSMSVASTETIVLGLVVLGLLCLVRVMVDICHVQQNRRGDTQDSLSHMMRLAGG